VHTFEQGEHWTRTPLSMKSQGVREGQTIFGKGSDTRARLTITLALPLLLTSCGDDSVFLTSVTTVPATTTTIPAGVTWTRIPHNTTIFGGPNRQEMRAVVAGGPGLVAVGYDDSGGDWDAAVWTGSPSG